MAATTAPDSRETSWAAATWTVPLMPAAVGMVWLAIGAQSRAFAGLGYTGLVVLGTVLVVPAVIAYRRGGPRLRGVGLGVAVGGTLTAILAAFLTFVGTA